MADPVLTVPRAWVESIDADRERLAAENARLRDQLEAAAMVRVRLEHRATLQAKALDRMAHVNRSAARALRDETRRLYARRRELDPATVLVYYTRGARVFCSVACGPGANLFNSFALCAAGTAHGRPHGRDPTPRSQLINKRMLAVLRGRPSDLRAAFPIHTRDFEGVALEATDTDDAQMVWWLFRGYFPTMDIEPAGTRAELVLLVHLVAQHMRFIGEAAPRVHTSWPITFRRGVERASARLARILAHSGAVFAEEEPASSSGNSSTASSTSAPHDGGGILDDERLIYAGSLAHVVFAAHMRPLLNRISETALRVAAPQPWRVQRRLSMGVANTLSAAASLLLARTGPVAPAAAAPPPPSAAPKKAYRIRWRVLAGACCCGAPPAAVVLDHHEEGLSRAVVVVDDEDGASSSFRRRSALAAGLLALSDTLQQRPRASVIARTLQPPPPHSRGGSTVTNCSSSFGDGSEPGNNNNK